MAAFTANQASVSNGLKVVTINSGESIANVRQGDFLFLAGFLVEINRGYVGGSSQQYIELVKNWANSNQSNQPALVIPTTGDFRAAVDAINNANKNVNDNFLAMQNWQTKTGTVTFVNQDGTTTTVKTLKQIEAEADTATTAAINAVETRAQTAYREAVEAASSGKNTVEYDAQGNPNLLVWINKFNCEDVNQAIIDRHGVDLQLGTGVHPAFIKNGVQIRGFWYAKYQASAGIGGGCSVVHGVQPMTNVNYDQAKSLCVNKGPGWHLASNAEWAAVAFLSLAYGNHVRGNTDYGRAHDAKYETGRREDTAAPGDSAGIARTYCGTGPATWSHDGTQFGVFDLVGNIWEFVDQLKIVDGQVIATLDNNPDLDETNWPAHECYLDSSAATQSAIVLNSLIANRLGTLGDSDSTGDYNSNIWASTNKSETYTASELMRKLAIEPGSADGNLLGWIYSRNYGERMAFRGAHWSYGVQAGLAAIRLNSSRTFSNAILGFRPSKFV